MTFGDALIAMKNGESVKRRPWMGSYIAIGRAWNPENLKDPAIAAPFIVIKTMDNYFQPWAAQHSDLLAEDWTQA
jgi:hypothetical protein